MENNTRLEQEILDTPAAERVAQKRAEMKATRKDTGMNTIVSRRKLIGAGLAGLAGLIVGRNLTLQPKSIPQQETEPFKTEGILNIDLANKILNSDPGSDTRKDLENSYTNEAIANGKLKDIDTAFWFVANTEDRVRLLEKRGEYRKTGKFGLRELTPEEKKFCSDKKLYDKSDNIFHEEWVAICFDSYERAKGILQNKITEMHGMENFIKQFRPDLEDLIKTGKIDPKKISLDDIMLPVGALIGIAWSESKTTTKDCLVHALVDVGKVASIDYITVEDVKNKNGIVDPVLTAKKLETVKQKEKNLFEKLSVNSIKYDPNKVPGSEKTGDIGSMQFRPDTVLDFIEFCKEKDIKEGDKDFSFNPSGLDAVTAACLMLSIGQIVPLDNGQEDWRMAYINGKEEGTPFYQHMIKSFKRWNGSLVNNILFWRNTYRQAMQTPPTPTIQKH